MKTLKLTPNPAPIAENVSVDSIERPQFVCPLTLKEMNGVQPFVYLQPCGCVLSQAGLKAVAGSSSPKDGEEEAGAAVKQLDICPQCATKYDKSIDVLLINPTPKEEERMFTAMTLWRASEPTKKSKKRKADLSSVPDAPPSKSKKTNGGINLQPHTNPSISAASRAVVSSLAAEELKRKAGMSEAVKSLYAKEGETRKETFMTMGTFTRVGAVHCLPISRWLTVV